MIVKVTVRDGEKFSQRISDDQAALDQQRLIESGMVIAGSNAFQTQLLCKRTGNRTIFTDAAVFTHLETAP